MARPPVPRRQQILEALARDLEAQPGSRMTTARLAASVGVSEAALYRHFPSKAKMFEALIEFAEESVFGLLNRIEQEGGALDRRLERAARVLLTFADRNPGITRVLVGDALVGENERLRARVGQFLERFEAQLRQMVRVEQANASVAPVVQASVASDLVVAVVEGRLSRFARGGFARSPLEGWEQQWVTLAGAIFPEPAR